MGQGVTAIRNAMNTFLQPLRQFLIGLYHFTDRCRFDEKAIEGIMPRPFYRGW